MTAATVTAVLLTSAAASSTSCIIPDAGIITFSECGTAWCASAPFAQALGADGVLFDVQQTGPDGTVSWVSECVCMTPEEDLVLQIGNPSMQYELLRNRILDATRQRCLEVALDDGLDPDPPFPASEQLEPSCYDAATGLSRDGCCTLESTQCEGSRTCDMPAFDSDGDSDPPRDPPP